MNIQNSNDTDMEDYDGVYEDVHLVKCNYGYMTEDGLFEFNMTCTHDAIWDVEYNNCTSESHVSFINVSNNIC